MRTRLVAVGVAAIAALLLSGCTGSTDKQQGPDTDATVNVGLVLEPTDLNIRRTSGAALDQVLIDNVYEGLVSRTPQGEIVDTIAKSHAISDDGLTYTFEINGGVTFHDGKTMTVDDIVWSLTQVKDDPELRDHELLSHVTEISAPDDHTVTLTLSEPDSNLLWNLSGRAGLVLEKAAKNDLATTANGTGPFTLDSWKQGDSITLKRNTEYWGDKAKVAEVVFVYISDTTAGVNAALAGDVDVLTAVDPNLRSQFDGTDFTVTEGKTTDKYTLAFNNTKAPLDDVRVRKALRLAVDHKAIIDAIGGAGVQMGGPIPPLDPGYEDLTSVRPFEPDTAKKLLAEAGQENLKLTLTVPNIYGTTVPNLLVSAYKKVGVTLTVDSVEFSTWLNDVYQNHDYDLSFVDHLEPRDFGNWANPDYYFGYDNKDVQKLYAESIAAVDPAAADQKLKEAARIVAEDHAADWLYNALTLTAVGKGISGFPTDSPNARLDLSSLAVTT
ncbi:peptide/nickel transport system substrate-binding protein [Paramicrobacterium humi]|uniref:Peptide/nickel transport system substrate-binding protein n=1 Tax=Paramicrobacterium humi TaxID=640635 RepID=A0A1H4P911_9MICO|nr:ABC transporter substrate-binding protein [Microbacterium humi]SEC03734.1 peptide/nickel transport system substrate-binding protein [Microbacterium humi]